ncbi:MAG: TlpA family protein disulfide reductase [Bacteroidia bacterium]|nr:TlpA family protein disulfide reductase [Bacteroidia bacterium]
MRKILPQLFLLLLLMQQGYSQTAAGHDFSMTQAMFEKEALQPKDEIWVIDFWASWCGPCIESIPHLKQIQRRYSDKKVRFISISWDESEVKWRSALDRFQMPWQHIRITKAQSAYFDAHFPHKAIPAAFVIRMDGKVKKANGVGMLEPTIQKAIKANKS